DVVHHVLGQAGVLVHLHRGRHIGERLHAGPTEHGQAFDRSGGLQLLEHRTGDVGPLLEHGALDAGHQGRGEPPRRDLALLHEQRRFALDRQDGGGAEADNEDDDDEDRDLEREARPDHRLRSYHQDRGKIAAMNLARLGDESVERFGEYVSLAFEGREWTNVEQQRVAHRFAHALRQLGLGPGDRAVVLLPNCPEVLQAYRAILAVGGVIVPVVFLLSAEEVRHILTDSEAKVVVTAPEFLDKLAGWTGPVVLGGGGPGGLAGDDLMAGQSDRITVVDRADEDLAVILYTAGTTGRPKGVALSHANLASNARAAASLYELDRTAWALMVLPLSHSYGLTVMNAGHILGTKGVLLRWFNPEAVLESIQRYRVQSMAGVPTMFVYLLNYPDADRFDTSSMRSWGSGAAPLPDAIVEPFEKKFGWRLLEGYGLTEASPVVSAHRYSGVRKLGSVGQAIPGVEVAILDDADQPLPVGEVGEVCVRGPNVMQGYYRLADETAAALRHGGTHNGS